VAVARKKNKSTVRWYQSFIMTEDEFRLHGDMVFDEMTKRVLTLVKETGRYSKPLSAESGDVVVIFNRTQSEGILVRLRWPRLRDYQGMLVWSHASSVHNQFLKSLLKASSRTAPYFKSPVWSME
jgi:hypothetical protein